jgi:hypothetical protein
MKTRTLFRAIAAAVVIVGCAAPPSSIAATCPGASCEVVVTVSGDPPMVAVSDNELHVPRGNSPVITWRLNAAGYEFRGDSITPHTAAPTDSKMTTTLSQWNSQIQSLSNTANRFMVKDKNLSHARLFYNVKVYRSSDGSPFSLDPAIINDF